jgi:capsular polysaccharide biosynthesis protein
MVVLVPAIVLPMLIVRSRMQPYQTSFKAVVLLPGDTEIPGSSERPELMVLDDLPTLVSSRVFAEAVATDLAGKQSPLGVDDVDGAIDGSRYSRVLTVTVARDSANDVRDIADSAAAVLPAQVNAYLVADTADPATVNIIDPPDGPSRSRPNQKIVILALTLLAAAVGAGIALLANASSQDQPNTGKTTAPTA